MRIFIVCLLVVFGVLLVGCPIANDSNSEVVNYTIPDDGTDEPDSVENDEVEEETKEGDLLPSPGLRRVSERQECIIKVTKNRNQCENWNNADYYVDDRTKMCYLIYQMHLKRSGMAPTDCASIGIKFDDAPEDDTGAEK